MNSKWHLYLSIIKSLIRILGCATAIGCSKTPEWSVAILALSFLIAEFLGIAEEIKDER